MILFVSNGHGEDTIGAALASRMSQLIAWRSGDCNQPREMAALPLVGAGDAYLRAGFRTVSQGMSLPSGGFPLHGLRHLAQDMRAGLVGSIRKQAMAFAREVARARLVIVVGDVYALFVTWVFGARRSGCPVVFIPTAKSAYVGRHFAAEKWFMRRVCRLVLPRDAPTRDEFLASGVRAEFCGNLMMDAIPPETGGLDMAGFTKVVGLLPGSRAEARQNMLAILEVVLAIHRKGGGGHGFVAALAGGFDIEAFRVEAAARGWRTGSPWDGRWPVLRFEAKEPAVILTTGIFGDVVSRADIFIGLAGTASEQACGMGKPVVTFPGQGPQFSRSFAVRQRRLLGDGVFLCEPSPGGVADAVLSILNDPARYHSMALAGRHRMSGPGAVGRACELIMREFDCLV